jgi:hypothetical protein
LYQQPVLPLQPLRQPVLLQLLQKNNQSIFYHYCPATSGAFFILIGQFGKFHYF